MNSTTETRPFLQAFAGRRRELDEAGPVWLREARRAHGARYDRDGLPTSKDEAWRATSVAPIASTDFSPPPVRSIERAELPPTARLDLAGPRLIFLDGRFHEELSVGVESESGGWIGSLSRAAEQAPEAVRELLEAGPDDRLHAFGALTGALWQDGAAIVVPDGVRRTAPIHIVFLSSGSSGPSASFPRTLIRIGREAQATVVESHLALAGRGVYLVSSLGQAQVADAGILEHYRLQLEAPTGYHVSHTTYRQGRDSRIGACNVDLGGRLVRNDAVAVLDGEGSHCRMNGLYLTDGEQHVDNHTVLDHARPHGDSRELYKGIVTDRSRAVFNGRIVVREHAQKTDAKQSNPNLVLGDQALAHTRPQLEIYADDVKCTHGATVGRLDEDAVFYLRSRGVPETDARNLLIRSFAGEVLDGIAIEALRDHLAEIVDERLRNRTDGRG